MRTLARNLDAERVATIAKSRLNLDGAKAASRDLTPFEASTVEGHLDDVRGLDAQIKGRAMVTFVMSLGSFETDYSGGSGGSIFTAAAKTGIVRAIQTRTPYRTELVGTKAAFITGALLPTSGTGVEPGLHPNSQFPLASLFSNMAATGPSQRCYRTTAGTATVVAEGGDGGQSVGEPGHTAPMQDIGNAVTILGIVVTFVAYFGQHSGVSLADLEPGLTARWNRVRGWARRMLGRKRTITVEVGTAWDVSSALSGTAMVWSPIRPGDDIAVRVDKLERNLDALHANLRELREHDQQRVREIADGLSKRVTELDHLVATRHEETRKAATAAMRWEVRGLLITLLGAGLSIFG